MNDEPNTLSIGTHEQFNAGAFDAELVDLLGQFILNLNEVIRLQQARIEDLEQRLASTPCVVIA